MVFVILVKSDFYPSRLFDVAVANFLKYRMVTLAWIFLRIQTKWVGFMIFKGFDSANATVLNTFSETSE